MQETSITINWSSIIELSLVNGMKMYMYTPLQVLDRNSTTNCVRNHRDSMVLGNLLLYRNIPVTTLIDPLGGKLEEN